ncbi:MAG: hypothetical protein IJX67_09675 [Oscillospiraceae bacterium]|nr:hypothetical protein [Oscillospiraceae bacterium]
MKNWKKVLNKVLYPPLWLIILLSIASAVLLPLVFIKGWEETPVAYAAYVVAFYTLSVLCLFFAAVLPGKYRKIKQKVHGHPLGNQYLTDAAFKVRISLYTSLAINLVYSAFKLVSGIYYRSLWIGAIAGYYILLSVIRFVLLNHMERKKNAGMIEEFRSYRISAVLMLLINLTLTGIVLNMILVEKTPAVSDVFVITNASYTFYVLTVSIIDLVKYRKYKSPVMSASKAIRFTQALVSLLSLEASMLVQFGDDESYRRLMLAVSGAGVCIIVLSMSVYMIVRANKEIKKIEPQTEESK